MGHVDISDQLRGTYRFDHWLRNYKWWHSIFWWGFQVLMVNSYLVYKAIYEDANRKPMSHYNYQKSIALAWINPEKYGKDSGTITPTDDNSTLSSMTKSSTASSGTRKKRRTYITTKSLHPQKGSLSDRTDRGLGHWPSPPPTDNKGNSNSPCQLCCFKHSLLRRV